MTSVKLRLNKTIKGVDGKSALVFQVLHERKRKLLYTKFRMSESDFDSHKERIQPEKDSGYSEQDVASMHRQLNRIRKELLQRIKRLESEWGDYTVHDVVILDKRKAKVFLLKSFDMRITCCEKENRKGMAAAFKSTKSSVAKFLKFRDVDLLAINKRFVHEYESALVCNGLSRNTIAYYMRNLRAIYNLFAESICRTSEDYPFYEMKMSALPTRKRSLKKEELICLVNAKFQDDEKHLDFARDFFLFSFYTRGMSLVDIIYLKKEDIQDKTIVYRRKKSKQMLQIGITSVLAEIINKYSHQGEFLLPILDPTKNVPLYAQYKSALVRINRNLKIIGEKFSFALVLTTYVARHSWAMQAKALGTPIAIISEGLGHASEAITQIYLKEFDTSIIDEVNEQIIKLQ